MANRLTTNPIYFETFNTDTTISTEPLVIAKIRWKGAADGDVLQLEDGRGNVILEDIAVANGDWRDIDFAGGQRFTEGLQVDEDQCTSMDAEDGTDALYIYLK